MKRSAYRSTSQLVFPTRRGFETIDAAAKKLRPWFQLIDGNVNVDSGNLTRWFLHRFVVISPWTLVMVICHGLFGDFFMDFGDFS